MPKTPSQDLQQRATSSRGDKAIFAGKCFMLSVLMEDETIPDKLVDDILASMWRQSEAILGIH